MPSKSNEKLSLIEIDRQMITRHIQRAQVSAKATHHPPKKHISWSLYTLWHILTVSSICLLIIWVISLTYKQTIYDRQKHNLRCRRLKYRDPFFSTKTLGENRTSIINVINYLIWDVNNHPRIDFKDRLVKSPLKLGHGIVIALHIFVWLCLVIHALSTMLV